MDSTAAIEACAVGDDNDDNEGVVRGSFFCFACTIFTIFRFDFRVFEILIPFSCLFFGKMDLNRGVASRSILPFLRSILLARTAATLRLS
ncbi:unnamed protein product [Linum tenue]|uniref:Uncharacterized protein n=1 Tax=Linum tenue TaxID=586396 RepID=A0AAV0NT09_9ROSI|nr:unnamed protein product [Linum tenue]